MISTTIPLRVTGTVRRLIQQKTNQIEEFKRVFLKKPGHFGFFLRNNCC